MSRGARVAGTALWVCAALVMLGAHVGGAAWLMREQPAMPSDEAPPAAIMIELAPEPEAVFTEATEVAPDQESAESSQPAEAVQTDEAIPAEKVVETQPEPVLREQPVETLPEEVVEQVVEPEETVDTEPVEQVTELEIEDLQPVEEENERVEEDMVMLPDAIEVPVPTARPKLPEPDRKSVQKEAPKKIAKKEATKQPQARNAASDPAVQAKAQTRQSNRNAARQSASGLFSSLSPAKWQSRLMAHLERRKRYPSGARSRREQGTVHVRFRIDDAGNVLSVSLARSSGFPELDNEVLSLVRRASPVPAPPAGVNKSITAPVRFSVR